MLERQNEPNLTFFLDQNSSKNEEGFVAKNNVEQDTTDQKQEKSYLTNTTPLAQDV